MRERMSKNNQLKNLNKIFIILLLAIVFVIWLDHKRKKINVGFPLDKIALKINEWEGTNMPVSETEKGWVEQGDLIIRNYKKRDDIVYMVAIQERGDRHRVHSPADCYSGSGWAVLKKDSVRLGGDKGKLVRRMFVNKDEVPRIVYYWFTNGRDQCASFKGHLVLFLKDVLLKGSIKSWVCFQISADIKTSKEDTETMLKEFILKLDYGV